MLWRQRCQRPLNTTRRTKSSCLFKRHIYKVQQKDAVNTGWCGNCACFLSSLSPVTAGVNKNSFLSHSFVCITTSRNAQVPCGVLHHSIWCGPLTACWAMSQCCTPHIHNICTVQLPHWPSPGTVTLAKKVKKLLAPKRMVLYLQRETAIILVGFLMHTVMSEAFLKLLLCTYCKNGLSIHWAGAKQTNKTS